MSNDDTKQQPTPADLARELIRLAEAADKADHYDDARDDYRVAHARTIAEALLAAEARVAELEVHLQTEREMHNAWRKRAEEAEAKPAGILGLVPGMRPVNPADLAEYEREMQQAIDELVLEQKRKWWGNGGVPRRGRPTNAADGGQVMLMDDCLGSREEMIERYKFVLAENAALKAELATLRSQLSRIDYAFGEPNEMRCSPYDVDLDGERVVRQVEAILKPLPEPPTEDK